MITGEVGTGKTTLCRAVLNNLDKNVKASLVLHSYSSTLQLLKCILKDFGIADVFTDNKFKLINALNNFLLEETGKGFNVALIIDEAQNLKINQLEEIRLLTNLETEKEKLIQIVLCGQPELHEKLKCPSLRQLNQRFVICFHLTAFNRYDFKDYI